MPRGLFSPEVFPEGWFDPELDPAGWFARDLGNGAEAEPAVRGLALVGGKLLAAGGSLMVVGEDRPCCLCKGCGPPGAETAFVMTPPKVEVTLTGVGVNPDIDWGGLCDPGNNIFPNYPSCAEQDCSELNDIYELPRGINPGADPHPDPNDFCNWSEWFEGFNCQSDWCPRDVEGYPYGGINRLHLSVHLQVALNGLGECEVLLFACSSFYDEPAWAAFGPFGDNFCYYGAGGGQVPLVIHTFGPGECLWALEGSYTLVLEGGAPGPWSHPFCNWDAAQVEVNFG